MNPTPIATLKLSLALALVGLLFCPSVAQEEPTLRTYDPQPALVVKQTQVAGAKFPAIDVHSHFGFRLKGDRQALKDFVSVMDKNKIALSVSFDAPLGNEDDHLKFLEPFQSRIPFFVHIDFVQSKEKDPDQHAVNQPDFVRRCVEQLAVAKKKGAVGVKLFKSFGLQIKNRRGELIKIDDPVFDPIWEQCGKLKLPVIMHVADPVAFFQPIDANNERWEELSRHPDWSFYGDDFPSRESLMNARNQIIERHSETIFIGAHVANNSEDLVEVAKWLDKYPNLMVEIASRINELGRQPYSARKFMIKYQDRVMFGTDGPWPELRLSYYWRFLETYDEHFPYSEKSPAPQGMWRIYGVGLPDEVLEKVYFKNALKIMPRLEKRYAAAAASTQDGPSRRAPVK
ncbi:MAG: amidohydrolase family protein [Planctomycetota bacterium]